MTKIKRFTTSVLSKISHKSIVMIAAFALTLSPAFVYANSYQDRIDSIDSEISEKEEIVKDLQKRANTLQNRLSIIAAEKTSIQAKIQKSEAEKRKLEQEINKTEKQKEQHQRVLASTLGDLYVGASISPIEMLASSKNISEYIDQAEYQSSIRDSLQNSIERIKQLKAQLDKQKADVETVLARQEGERAQLTAKESEQSQLLAQTRGEESAYKEMVADLRKKKQEAEAALVASLQTGNYKVASAGPIRAGEVVGGVGSTGMSTGPHLHLEVRVGGSVVDPAPYIRHQPVPQPPAWVSQHFWNPDPMYVSGFHPGVDYAADFDTPIFAIDNGVLYRGCSAQMFGTTAYGYVAVIEHASGAVSVYGHMNGGC